MSTTHTTVGAIVGMSLVLQGAGAVAWNERTNEFPFFTGISTVVASWYAVSMSEQKLTESVRQMGLRQPLGHQSLPLLQSRAPGQARVERLQIHAHAKTLPVCALFGVVPRVLETCECCCRRRFISPIVSAIIVTILFGLVRTFVLRSQHSFKRAFYVLPALVTLTFFVIVIFILQTNNKNQRCALHRGRRRADSLCGSAAKLLTWPVALQEHLPKVRCDHRGRQPAPLDSTQQELCACHLGVAMQVGQAAEGGHHAVDLRRDRGRLWHHHPCRHHALPAQAHRRGRGCR